MNPFRRRPSVPPPLSPSPHCDEVGHVLQSYLDGELGPEDTELVAAHLEHCERCNVELETFARVVAAIHRQRPDLDAEALDRLGRFVEQLGPEPEER